MAQRKRSRTEPARTAAAASTTESSAADEASAAASRDEQPSAYAQMQILRPPAVPIEPAGSAAARDRADRSRSTTGDDLADSPEE